MTPYVVITLEGTPIGKERPRYAGGNVFTPAKTKAFEEALGLKAKEAMRGKEIIEAPVRVEVSAYFPIPKTWGFAKQRNAAENRIRPVTKPDADNILKTLDGLNAIAFCDDRQIIEASINKYYAVNPRLEIKVYKLPEYYEDEP